MWLIVTIDKNSNFSAHLSQIAAMWQMRKFQLYKSQTRHEKSNTPNWVHLVHFLDCPSFLLPGVKSIKALLNYPLSFDECALISNKNLNTSFVYKTASYKVMENCPSGICAGMSYQQSPVDLSYQANPKLQFEKSNIPLLEIRSGKVREQHCDIEWLCAGMPCQQRPP